jgi:hypothetical protein
VISLAERQQDLGDILRSPLDEPDPPIPWFPLLGGIVVGGLVVIVAYLVAGASSTTEASSAGTTPPITAPATPTTTPPGGPDTAVPVDAAAFPPGYLEVSSVYGAKPVYAMRIDDDVVVAVDAVAHRGVEPTNVFAGDGRWVLETGDGADVEATSVTSDVFLRGSFSVLFPGVGEADLGTLRLVELWEGQPLSGTADVAAGPDLGSIGDVTVPLEGGVSVEVTGLELTDEGGGFSWSVDGAEMTSGLSPTVWARSAGQDQALWTTAGSDSPLFFVERRRLEAAASGDVVLSRQAGFEGDLSSVDTVVVDIGLTMIVPLPADVEWDMADVPLLTP